MGRTVKYKLIPTPHFVNLVVLALEVGHKKNIYNS